MSKVTPEMLRKVLAYDPSTGVLKWLERSADMFADGAKSAEWQANAWNAKYAGKEAFRFRNRSGHMAGRVFSEGLLAHRAAWAIYFGEWPKDQIDHINGQADDNRMANLRVVSDAGNKRNRRMRSDNRSGVTGVSFVASRGKWIAQIAKEGRKYYLGIFKDCADAVAVRAASERALGFDPNHGKQPVQEGFNL